MAVIPELPRLDPNPEFSHPSPVQRLQLVAQALERNGFHTLIASSREEARRLVLDLVPEGAEVHTGLSETMRELGITAEIEESKRFDPIRPRLMRLDRETQMREIRKLATAPDYMLGSVHAVTEDGTLIAASGTGSQLAPYANGAGQLILVVGSQKIVRDVEEGLRRVREYSLPLEDARMSRSAALAAWSPRSSSCRGKGPAASPWYSWTAPSASSPRDPSPTLPARGREISLKRGHH
jgi:L-lactate utilization protein LutC